MADGQGVKRGIKKKAASRAFTASYSSITEFMTPAVEWAPKLYAKGMISRSTRERVTNQAAFVDEPTKAIQMLQDLERYITSSNADLFWHLVCMVSEKEMKQEGGGGRLALNLAAAYKTKGGGEEIDSALLSDHEHDAPVLRSQTGQPTSNGPSCPDSTSRSQSVPLPVPVQESSGGEQGVLVTLSPVESDCPSLPLGQAEQGDGSLVVDRSSEDQLSAVEEESKEIQQHRQPPAGDSPSSRPPSSSLPQVGGAPEHIVVQRNTGSGAPPAEKKLKSVQHVPSESAAPCPSDAEGGSTTNWSGVFSGRTLAVSVFMVLLGVIVWGCYGMLGGGKDQPGEGGRNNLQSCTGLTLDYTQSQPLMRILEEEVIAHFAEHWQDLGNQLQVPPAKLTAVEKDNPKDVKARMREVIKFWLKGNGREPHTLGTLAAAVEKSNCPTAAERLSSHPELCKKRVTAE